MWKLSIRNHTTIYEEVKIKWPLYRKETRGIRACSCLPTNSVSGLSLLGAPSPTLDPAWPSTLITTYWNILQLSASQLWLILSNAVIVAILLQLFTLYTLKSTHGLWQNCKMICSLIFSSGIKPLESHNHPHHSDFLSMQTSSFYSILLRNAWPIRAPKGKLWKENESISQCVVNTCGPCDKERGKSESQKLEFICHW